MGGDPQVAHLSGGFGLLQGLPGPAGAEDLVDLLDGQVVDLIDVDVVGAQVAQAGLDVPAMASLSRAMDLVARRNLSRRPARAAPRYSSETV